MKMSGHFLRLLGSWPRKYNIHSKEGARKLATQSKVEWQPVIGLEIHAQILSNSKLFSPAGTDFYSPVNSEVAPFDAAIPGTLPVLNKRAVVAAVKTALALNCNVQKVSWFDRKHYFYADLPAGYQITQQSHPIAVDGHLEYPVCSVKNQHRVYTKTCRIKQIQLEQDSGRSLHDEIKQRSLIDLNRAGIGLMEIVFEPEVNDSEEAVSLVKELILILKTLESCNCHMEEGSLRVDANVSVHKQHEPFGTRTEIKNLNSLHCISHAINYEIARQIKLLESGGTVINETLSYDTIAKRTLRMRDKEEKQDYRYMPEPNLPPLRLCDDSDPHPDLINISEIKNTIELLPREIRKNLVSQYDIPLLWALIITSYWELMEYSLEVFKVPDCPSKEVTKILLNSFLQVVNKEKLEIKNVPLRPDTLVNITKLHLEKVISTVTRDKIVEMIIKGDERTPLQIVKDRNWTQISDSSTLEPICRSVIERFPKDVKAAKKGKHGPFQKLLKIIQSETDDRADMKVLRAIVENILDKSD